MGCHLCETVWQPMVKGLCWFFVVARVRLHQQPPWSHARWNDDISAQQGLLLAWYNWARNLRCYTTSRMNLRARESDLLHNLHRGLGRAAPHGRHHVACFGQCMEHTCL